MPQVTSKACAITTRNANVPRQISILSLTDSAGLGVRVDGRRAAMAVSRGGSGWRGRKFL